MNNSDIINCITAIIKSDPQGSKAKHLVMFEKKIRTPDYTDLLSAVIASTFGLHYRRCEASANPPTINDIEDELAARRKQKQEDQAEVDRIKRKVISRLLDFMTPLDKALRDCTGNECALLGGFFERVADKVPARQKVGDCLSNNDLQKLFTQHQNAA